MKSTVIRTAIVSSVITAVLVSALGLWAVPKLMNPQTAQAQDQDSVLQPAVYSAAAAQPSDQPVLNPRPGARRASTSTYNDSTHANNPTVRDAYGEPVHHHRTTDQSALIVAGSAGTGAAIGAIAGGGKGAAIGAISGGAAGFIYDRLTANK
ncbi:MAG: hypothetical protein LAN70_04505 [Acidobacteriia bacterium]|nr:hypothetical protein [Terriglobia bacterium]